MSPNTTPHAELRDLAEGLMVEYRGALPPGQVLAAVYRAHRAVAAGPPLSLAARLSTVEAVVRRVLTDRLALLGSAPLRTSVPA